jgi:ribosomal-protein-alanine N-acetyltransferase
VTELLVLRPWRDEDLPAFAALNADPRVMEHFPSVLTRLESDAVAGRIRAHIAERGFGLWAVELRSGAPFIGFVGLLSWTHPEPVPFRSLVRPCIEVGWRLAAEHWGRGYATEAAFAALGFGFSTLELPEIVAMTATQNLASRRVMEKLGMKRDPADDFDHPRVPLGHRVRRHVLYRIGRADFEARR